MSSSMYGFHLFNLAEFTAWLAGQSVSRVISRVQEHHTWSPRYAHFTGTNHFALQKGMRNYHVINNGWADIGQHFSIFPDGAIVTGRALNSSPACIYGNNSGSICIENVGDFDAGKDAMTPAQESAIIGATAALARRFNLNPVTTNNIVYHHWFDLNTGLRTNGTGTTKSCPGTAFFGGNSVANCTAHFLPRVQALLNGAAPVPAAAGPAAPDYGVVVASALNVRAGPSSTAPLITEHGPLATGAIVRIFGASNGWLKIAASHEKWVFAKWISPVARKIVNTDDSKGRAGPDVSFEELHAFMRGEEVFVHGEQGSWSRISLDDLWIHSSLIT